MIRFTNCPTARLPRLIALAPLAALGLLGCGSQNPDELPNAIEEPTTSAPTSTSASALTNEIGGVAEAAARYYPNAMIARTSYATPSFFSAGGCSATMIGPNVLMTAAHCGQQRSTAVFRTYRDLNVTQGDQESFVCDPMVSTFCDADTIFYHCRPNAVGENPGDKYGYLDFDTNVPTVGTNLFSVWSNSIDNLGIGSQGALLYSPGKVTATNDNGWYVAANNSTGVTMDLWGQPGASGSSHVSAASGRVQIGPLTTATVAGGRSRAAGSMNNILYWGASRTGSSSECAGFKPWDEATISGLGLDPNRYKEAWIDRDSNWLVDIQEDLEKKNGENRRDFYWLGFESQRRNALWSKTNEAQFLPTAARVDIARTASGTSTVLSHSKLNLEPGVRYRWGVRVAMTRGVVTLVVRDGAGNEVTRKNIFASMSGTQTLEFTAPTGARLEVLAGSAAQATLSHMSVARDWTYTTFELADERAAWIDAVDAQPAMILPDGEGSGPNWALRVDRRAGVSRDVDVRSNDNFALVAGKGYTICFDVKNATASTASNPGRMQLLSGGSVMGSVTFRPTSTWTSVCSAELRPTTSQSSVRFNVDSDVAAPGFLVDRVVVFRSWTD